MASFIAMYLLLESQSSGVKSLQIIGKVGVALGEVYIAALSLDMLFNGWVRADF